MKKENTREALDHRLFQEKAKKIDKYAKTLRAAFKRQKKKNKQLSKGMQALYDFCNDGNSPNSITKSKMRKFVTEKEIKLIMSRLRGITLTIPKKGQEQEYPATDIMFGIKQEPFMWD